MLSRLKLPSLKRRQPGWLAVQLHGEQMTLCHVDCSGERPTLRLALQGAASELAGWRRRYRLEQIQCVSVLNAGRYNLLQTEAPEVPREEWRAALRWKLKDLLDYPDGEAVFDLADIPTEAFAPGRARQCFVVAAERCVVQAAVEPLLQARLDLAAVDVPEMAQRNLAALFEEENRAVAFLTVDAHAALLTVTFHGELYGARRIEVGGDQLASADEFRRQQLLERIALETQRTLDAFDRQYNFMTVTRLILALPPAEAAVADALAANIYIPVVPMDLAQVVDLAATPELRDDSALQIALLPVIGAALRQEAA